MERHLWVEVSAFVVVANFLRDSLHSPSESQEVIESLLNGVSTGRGFEVGNMACTQVHLTTLAHTPQAMRVDVDFEMDSENERRDD